MGTQESWTGQLRMVVCLVGILLAATPPSVMAAYSGGGELSYLDAFPADCSAMTLTWDTPTNINGDSPSSYRVYRNGVYKATVYIDGYTDAAQLSANTSYTWAVIPYYGTSSARGASITVNTGSCAVATLATTSLDCESRVRVSWSWQLIATGTNNIIGNPSSYKVYRDSTYLGSTTALSFDDPTQLSLATYSYTVYPVFGVTLHQGKTTSHTLKDLAIRNVSVLSTDPRSIELQFTQSADPSVTGFALYRNNLFIGAVSLRTVTQFTDSLLDPLRSYHYALYPMTAQGTCMNHGATITGSTADRTALQASYTAKVILVKFSDSPDPLSTTKANSIIFDQLGESLHQLLLDVSYYRTGITRVGPVTGVRPAVTLARTSADGCSNTDTGGSGGRYTAFDQAKAAYNAANPDDTQEPDFYIVLPAAGAGCESNGGEFFTRPTGEKVLFWFPSITNSYVELNIGLHEFLHSKVVAGLRIAHAARWDCSLGSPVGSNIYNHNSGDCTVGAPYGDVRDTMGPAGALHGNTVHPNVYTKWLKGWIDDAQLVVPPRGTSTHILDSANALSSGVKGLKIPIDGLEEDAETFYIVEYREGWNSNSPSVWDYVEPGIYIRVKLRHIRDLGVVLPGYSNDISVITGGDDTPYEQLTDTKDFVDVYRGITMRKLPYTCTADCSVSRVQLEVARP